MDFVHTKDGGDIKGRTCQTCGKKWGIADMAVATDIRMRPISYKDKKKQIKEKAIMGQTSYSSWADSIPFVSTVARFLPNWSRKWRISSFISFYIFIIAGLAYLWDWNQYVAQTIIVLMVLPFILLGIGLLRSYFGK